jgi:hypothetical protein
MPGSTGDGICQEVRPCCLETDASKNLALPILDLHILAVHGFNAAGAACTGSHGPKPHLGGQEKPRLVMHPFVVEEFFQI